MVYSLIIFVLDFLDLMQRGITGLFRAFTIENFKKLIWLMVWCTVVMGLGLLFSFACFCAGFPAIVTRISFTWQQIQTVLYKISRFFDLFHMIWPIPEWVSHAKRLISVMYLRVSLCMYDLTLFKAALIEESFQLIQVTTPNLTKSPRLGTLVLPST